MSLSEMERLDRDVAREECRLTVGASALHAMDPAEAMMRMEEEAGERMERERHALQCEIFNGMLEYLLADGPAPECVRRRLEGLLGSFAPGTLRTMRGPHVWADPAEVVAVLRQRQRWLREVRVSARGKARLFTWAEELKREEDVRTVAETISGLVRYWLSEGPRWRNAVATSLCLAKAWRPELIGGMSLDQLARLCGDGGGRATPSARIRRLYNDRVDAAGRLATQVHFQKSAAACERYAKAQKDNSNRRKKRRRVA